MATRVKRVWRWAALAAALFVPAPTGFAQSPQEIMRARGPAEKDVAAAAKTYVPTGKHDDDVVFRSGGNSGQVVVHGVPAMRILKYIGVLTPEPWQGRGYGDEESRRIRSEGRVNNDQATWADPHHPALPETDGDDDGQLLFIDDMANLRGAAIDLNPCGFIRKRGPGLRQPFRPPGRGPAKGVPGAISVIHKQFTAG